MWPWTKAPAKVTRTSQNGLSRLSTDDWTYGKVNGGGPEVMLKTFNGDIFLRKADSPQCRHTEATFSPRVVLAD